MAEQLSVNVPQQGPSPVEELKFRHSHRTPDDRAQKLLRRIRQEFLNLAVFIEEQLPYSRDRSLVQTKLDEARMWACSAAVSKGVIREELTINHSAPAE